MNNSYNIHYILYLLLFLITGGFSTQVMAQAPEISPQLIKVSKKRISRTVYEFTFKATLINHDVPIKNVTASITSNSPHTIIMSDNTVSFNDVAANETVTSVDTFTLRQDRKFPYNPADIHWDIQYEQVASDVKINLISMTCDIYGCQLLEDESTTNSIAIDFSSKQESIPYTVRLSQTVSPSTGLTLTPSLDGAELTYTTSSIDEQHQTAHATQAGEYTVTTTATIVETGQSKTRSIRYKVLPAGTPDISLPPPSIKLESWYTGEPTVLKPDTVTKVAFSMSFKGRDSDKVTGITVIEPTRNIVVELNDAGLGIDFKANDNIYASDYIDIDSTGINTGECLHFHAIVHTTLGDVRSRSNEICVSALGMTFRHAEEDRVYDILSNSSFARNTLSVKIKKGTSDARILAIAASVDCTVVSGNPRFGSYTFKLNHPSVSPLAIMVANVLKQKIRQLEVFPEVISAGPTMFGHILGSYTNDILYKLENSGIGTAQVSAMTQTRADEAWLVVRGQAPIAVIDTGIDTGHEDLDGKVMTGGYNLAEKNTDFQDLNHHGSHVSGIAAAQSNNGKGIAGVSWNSQILPLKIYPGSAGSGSSGEVMASAIERAANDDRIEIINFSTGFSIPLFFGDDERKARKLVCDAVAYAVSLDKIFIASAGNLSRTKRVYPAACPGAIAVGAVEPSSNQGGILGAPVRWTAGPLGSHYGDWVTMAAAGSQVLSTVPEETCSFLTDPFTLLFPCLANTTDGYRAISGTSEAAPMVSGAAAVVWARHPDFKPLRVIARLKETAIKMPDEGLGAGALNVFDAVFNGDFELPYEFDNETGIAEWSYDESGDHRCRTRTDLFGIYSPSGEQMLICDNGGTKTDGSFTLSKQSGVYNVLDIPEGVTELPLSFQWKLATEEFRWRLSNGDAAWNDRVIVELVKQPTGQTHTLLNVSVNDLRYEMSSTWAQFIQQSEWHTFSQTVPVQKGRYTLRYRIEDEQQLYECQRTGFTLIELNQYLNCLQQYPNGYYKNPVENDYLGNSYLLVDQIKFRIQ